jgi:hypothetical protein
MSVTVKNYDEHFLNRSTIGNPEIFLNPFSGCSPCKRKFDICPLIYEETIRSNPFVNGLTEVSIHGSARYFEEGHKRNFDAKSASTSDFRDLKAIA